MVCANMLHLLVFKHAEVPFIRSEAEAYSNSYRRMSNSEVCHGGVLQIQLWMLRQPLLAMEAVFGIARCNSYEISASPARGPPKQIPARCSACTDLGLRVLSA